MDKKNNFFFSPKFVVHKAEYDHAARKGSKKSDAISLNLWMAETVFSSNELEEKSDFLRRNKMSVKGRML